MIQGQEAGLWSGFDADDRPLVDVATDDRFIEEVVVGGLDGLPAAEFLVGLGKVPAEVVILDGREQEYFLELQIRQGAGRLLGPHRLIDMEKWNRLADKQPKIGGIKPNLVAG